MTSRMYLRWATDHSAHGGGMSAQEAQTTWAEMVNDKKTYDRFMKGGELFVWVPLYI